MQNNVRHTLAPCHLTAFTILKTLSLIFLLAGQASQALAQQQQQQCPALTVSCPRNALGGTSTFTANPAIGGLTYEWTVDAGTIASGQGTPVITVIDVLGSVKAVVQNTGCSNAASCTSTVVPMRRSWDSFVFVTNDDAKARLDNFAIALQNEPGAKGYIIVTGKGRGSVGEKKARFASNYLTNYRGIEHQRLETGITSEAATKFADKPRLELWIVPAGAAPPKVEPSIKPTLVPTRVSPRSRTRIRGDRLRRLD